VSESERPPDAVIIAEPIVYLLTNYGDYRGRQEMTEVGFSSRPSNPPGKGGGPLRGDCVEKLLK